MICLRLTGYRQLVEYEPSIGDIRKIIYDWKTGEMYVSTQLTTSTELIVFRHICGFWDAELLDGHAKWDDYLFVQFDLVSDSKSDERYFDITAIDTYHDEKGWRW